jgi:ADP-ribose pyrophosphatase YjhB (NUDIX family)
MLMIMKRCQHPLLTVDIIININGGIVLIERKNPPPGWALPGGFVDYNETIEHAAIREAKEETSLDIKLLEQFYTYSDPKRDPRGHTISTVFIAEAIGKPVAADDAKACMIFSITELPSNLAFDHGKILNDYMNYIKTGRRPSPGV